MSVLTTVLRGTYCLWEDWLCQRKKQKTKLLRQKKKIYIYIWKNEQKKEREVYMKGPPSSDINTNIYCYTATGVEGPL